MVLTDNKPFDTGLFFSGGAGMFLMYHDVVKPVYLYAILQMMLTNQSYGLPIDVIKNMSIVSIIEWYIHRRFKNPLKQLDYANKIDVNDLDNLMRSILHRDPSIYKMAPTLNIEKLMYVYKSQHMTFPIYIYNEDEEPAIVKDCHEIFSGIEHHCIFGDLNDAINKCDQNFTYIFSDIELVKNAAEILLGTCSHILLTRDYRYNYVDNYSNFKYDLKDLAMSHPFLRIGTTIAMNPKEVVNAYAKLVAKEEEG